LDVIEPEGAVGMRNVWKGMVIGAFTGAAAGLVLDLGERGVERAAALGGAVANRAPKVADHLRDSVGDAVDAASQRARTSDLPAQARATSVDAHENVTAAVSEGLQLAGEAAQQTKETLAGAVDRAKDAVARS
jgi:hypothetical protein